MDKEPKKKLLSRLIAPFIVLLVIPLLWGSNIQFHQRFHNFLRETISSSGSNRKTVEVNSDSLDFLLSRLVQEQDLKSFRATGFSCDTQLHSKHCVTNRATQIDTATMTVTIPSENPVEETFLRPYARQEDEALLKKVTPVRIVRGDTTPPACDYSHRVPAVVFSTSGFTGNAFHEMDEIIIPLFITASLFDSRVLLVIEDYRPSFIEKYSKILFHLTSYEIVNAAANRSVHCFPAVVVGLKFHGYLSLNSSDVPRGLSTHIFRQFLRQSYDLSNSHVSQIMTERPTVMLLSRTTTRRIINEDEVVAMMEDLGFRVVVAARAKVMSNLTMVSGLVNSCSVLVGTHGAGLTNGVYLPDGAVVVQVDLIGLEWPAAAYFGTPYGGMGDLHYLRYKIEAEESSLFKIFGSRSHQAIMDPRGAFPAETGREVYLNSQNVNINVDRFRQTMAMAMSLVRESSM